LAARLEGQSKGYGVDIVLGPDTAANVRDEFATLELDLIKVKGKKDAVDIHCLLGGPERRQSPEFTALREKHREFLAAYRDQDWDKAEALMTEVGVAANGDLDNFHEIFRERIADFRENPRDPDWDGVYVAETK
jgi:adenylate cyclase